MEIWDRFVRRARHERPQLRFDEQEFIAHLASLHPEEREFEGLHAGDLLLAYLCARGDRAALNTFEDEVMSATKKHLRRFVRSPEALDEALQLVRAELLVHRDDKTPRILSYGGRGPLAAWVRTVARRTAARRFDETSSRPHDPVDRIPSARGASTLHSKEVRRALESALADLSRNDRDLLRMHYLEGWTLQELAGLHGVSKATAGRWVARAAEQVRAALGDVNGDADDQVAAALSVSRIMVDPRKRSP